VSGAFYNEHDPFAAAWLRELIKAGLIADGVVDERSIEDVVPAELMGYTQCHFFAGIGVWSYALRQAGWSDDRPIWTGSCPCQPFSEGGKKGGFADERHLWPAFHHLIRECRPSTVIGEQVAKKDGYAWFDLVSADLEGDGYTAGAVDTCAAGFGAPHIRQRLYWVAYAKHNGQPSPAFRGSPSPSENKGGLFQSQGRSAIDGLDNTQRFGWGEGRDRDNRGDDRLEPDPTGGDGVGQPDTISNRPQGGLPGREDAQLETFDRPAGRDGANSGGGPTNGFWGDADWLYCRGDKWRPVEPRTFPLAHGATNRVGRLRGYGNAIVAPQAQAFIEAVMGVI
jgi:DNA (cytosine-5)-methyltransferase 1